MQVAFRKGRGTRDQTANICFCFTDYAKAFVWITTPLWNILHEMGIPDHLTCMQVREGTVRARQSTMGWFKIEKGV